MQKALIIIILMTLPLVFGTVGFCAESATTELCYGNLLALHNKYELAVSHFDKAIELDPNLAQAYSHRAAALVEMGKYKEALKDCSRSIELDPKNVHTYVLRGLIYKQLGKCDKEREDMLAANKLLPVDKRKRIRSSTNNGPIEFNYDPDNGTSVKLHGLSE